MRLGQYRITAPKSAIRCFARLTTNNFLTWNDNFYHTLPVNGENYKTMKAVTTYRNLRFSKQKNCSDT